jgi:uncharacterized protein DUF5403
MAKVEMYKSCNQTVSTLPGVRDSVREVGGEIYFKAVANLAAHRHSGNARIEITDAPLTSVGGKTYSNWGITVSMIDEKTANAGGPGALAIEFGHFAKTTTGFPRYVEGLHILGRASGLRS